MLKKRINRWRVIYRAQNQMFSSPDEVLSDNCMPITGLRRTATYREMCQSIPTDFSYNSKSAGPQKGLLWVSMNIIR